MGHGKQVAIVDLMAGEMGTRGTPALRAEERAAATKLLGVQQRFQLNLPDSAIGRDPDHQQTIIQVIRQLRPRIVLAPNSDPGRHPDHAATGKLVRDACFLAGVAKVGTGIPYRPAWLYHYMLHQPFDPAFIVDVSGVWAQKWASIHAYESQFGAAQQQGPATAINQPHFLRFIEARAIYYGGLIGATYGEPFWAAGPVSQPSLPGLDTEPQYKPYL